MLTDDLASRALFGSAPATAHPSDTQIEARSGEAIAVHDAHLMFQGDYHKVGFDLVIEDGASRLTIHDYFRVERRPSLISDGGAALTPDVVAALALTPGGVHYAQAGAPAPAPAAIGRVETMTGQATAIRNGTPVVLNQGALVYKGDVVQTDRGSSLGIGFIDGTTFNLSASARMVLNDMVYQPGGQQNSALLNIVQGSVSFLAGQVAKTGDMKVGTPVATMGIRGTLVNAEISADDGTVRFAVLKEPSGESGRYDLIRNGQVIATVDDPNTIYVIGSGGLVTTLTKGLADQLAEQLITQQIFQIVSLGQANPLLPATGPGVPSPGPGGGGGGGSSTDPNINGGGSPFGGTGGTGNGGNINPGGNPIGTPFAAIFLPVTTAGGFQTLAPVTVSLAAPATTGTITPAGPAVSLVVLAQTGGPNDGSPQVAVPSSGEEVAIIGLYGTFFIRADGTQRYEGHPPQALAEGEQRTDTFTYTVDDGTGQRLALTRSFDVVGVNDAPTVGSAISAAFAEGGRSAALDLLAGAADPDNGETSQLRIANVSYSVDGSPESATAPVGIALSGTTLTVDPADPAFDHLPAGVIQRITVGYDIVDPHGATVHQTATIVVTGTNDAPTATPLTDAVNEGGASLSRNLLAGASDPDDGETATLQVANVTYSIDSGPASSTAPKGVTLSGTTLTVDPADPAFDHLPAGVIQRITVGYDIVDPHGATVHQTATIVVTGTNDAPTATPLTDAVTEGGASLSRNLLSGAADPDDGETATLQVANVTYSIDSGPASTSIPKGVTLSGTTLSVDPTDSAFDHLPAGATERITVSYDVVDAQGAKIPQTETITVTGVNDAAMISGAATGSVTEAGGTGNAQPGIPTASGTLTDTDVDGPTNTFRAVTNPAASDRGFGSFTIDASGNWTYVLDNANATVQGLGAGATATDTFTVRTADGTPTVITIAIAGANDDPTAVSDIARTRLADNPATPADESLVFMGGATTVGSVSVLANDTDPDVGDTLRIVSVSGSGAPSTISGPSGGVDGQYGHLTINADGSYSYQAFTPTADQPDIVQDAFSYTVSDSQGATASATLTINVGRPPAPATDRVITNNSGTFYIPDSALLFNDRTGAFDTSLSVDAATAGTNTVASHDGTYHLVMLSGTNSGSFVGRSAEFDYEARGDQSGQTATAHVTALTGGNTKGGLSAEAGGSILVFSNTDSSSATFSGAGGGRDVFVLQDLYSGTGEGTPPPYNAHTITNYAASEDAVDISFLVSDGTPFSVDASGHFLHLVEVPNSSGTYDLYLDRQDGGFQTVAHLSGADSARIIWDHQNVLVTGVVEPTTNDVSVSTSQSSTVGIDLTGSSNATAFRLTSVPDPSFGHFTRDSAGTQTLTAGDTVLFQNGAPELFFVPAADASGSASFSFAAFDGSGARDRTDATGTITVTGGNHAPVAVDDFGASVTENAADETVTGNLLTNDTDQDGDPLSVTYVVGDAVASTVEADGLYGHLSVVIDTGAYTYTLYSSYDGATPEQVAAADALRAGDQVDEKFTYQVEDGQGGSDFGELHITVNGANDNPVASDDANVAEAGGAPTVADTREAGVLGNDNDPDSGERDTLTVASIRAEDGSEVYVGASQPGGTTVAGLYGSLTIYDDGHYSYVADNAVSLGSGETQDDVFIYEVQDVNSASAQGRLTITVSGQNDAPTITSQSSAEIVSQSANGDPGNGPSLAPAISASGRFVVFATTADNLGSGPDANGVSDIYVRDLAEGTTTRVSLNPDGSEAATGSFDPTISADGRFIAFRGGGPDPNFPNSSFISPTIFLADRVADTVTALPVTGYGDFSSVRLSDDGTKLVFVAPQAAGSSSDAYLYDIATDTTTLVASSDPQYINSLEPRVSADGRYVTFEAFSTVTGSYDLFVRDVQAGTTSFVSYDTGGTQHLTGNNTTEDISADGRFVLFHNDGSGTAAEGFYLRDLSAGTTQFVSPGTTNYTNAAALSDDGHTVVFRADGALTADDTNGLPDVYLIDPFGGMLPTRLTADTPGFAYNGGDPAISADGLARVVQSTLASQTQIDVQQAGFTEYAGTTGDATAHTLHGSVTFSDPDANDRPTAYVPEQAISYSGGSLTDDQSAAIRSGFSVAAAPGTTNAGVVAYTYTVADDALDFLALGETVTLTSTIRIDDGHGATADTTVTLTIRGANDAPVSGDGAVGGATTGVQFDGTLPSATDPDQSDTITYAIPGTSTANSGTVTLTDASTGAFTYTSSNGFTGADTFTFTVLDGHGGAHSYTETVNVDPAPPTNSPPTASDGTFDTNRNTTYTGTLPAAFDPNGDATFFFVSNSSTAQGGTVTITDQNTGAFTYTPAQGFYSTGPSDADSFTFSVSDGTDSTTYTETINVIEHAPEARNGFASITAGTAVTGRLPVATDADAGETLTYLLSGSSGAGLSAHSGTVTITDASTGAFTYTPASGFTGTDSFTFAVTDGALGSGEYTISVAVGASQGGRFGAGLATLGDVDNDGLSDIATGSPNDNGGTVFISDSTRLPNDPQQGYGYLITDSSPGARFGSALAGTSDLNGDHVGDLVAGAPGESGGAGAIYVAFGRGDPTNTASIATSDFNGLAGAPGFIIRGAAPGDHAGSSVASAGYVNADATPDILVGAPDANGGAGAAYLVYGKATTADVSLAALGAGGVAIGGAAGDHAGFSVAGGGDINRDGFADIVVGAPHAAGSVTDAGGAYVLYGSNALAGVDLSTLTPSQGFKITGAATGDLAGFAVANVGDVNGDGYDDVAIGAPHAGLPGRPEAGAVYVVFGFDPQAANAPTGIDLANLGDHGFAIYGAAPGDHLGSAIAGIGDADADGLADFVIAAPNAAGSGTDRGSAYIVHGTASTSAIDLLGQSANISGFLADGDELGTSVTGTGDQVGTGLPGTAEGAPNHYDASSGTVEAGFTTGTGPGAFPAAAIVGTSSSDDGNSGAFAGTTGNDIIAGLQGNDILVSNGGSDYLFGGSGADLFVFHGNDLGGVSKIADFHPLSTLQSGSEHDRINLDGFSGFDSYADLTTPGHLSQPNSHDTLITLDNEHAILLKNVIIASLAAADFTFGPNSST